jgi:hypothetical protein
MAPLPPRQSPNQKKSQEPSETSTAKSATLSRWGWKTLALRLKR